MLQTRDTEASSSLFHPLLTESGTAMLFVLVLAVICTLLIGSVSLSSRFTLKRSGVRRAKVAALNIAEAGKESFYAMLLRDKSFTPLANVTDQVVFDNFTFKGGFFSVKYTTGANPYDLMIRATGTDGTNTVELEVQAEKRQNVPVEGLAARLSGAVLARSNVDITGGFIANGNDHDSLGNQVGPGTFGVYTSTLMSLNGSSEIGGNGVAPVGKKDILSYNGIVYRENAPLDSTFPLPETVFGLPGGCMDTFAKPASAYPEPLSGLVYINQDYSVPKKGVNKGILIVHNSTGTAELSMNAQSEFVGLIICDRVNKLNGGASIIGSVVVLDSISFSNCCNGGAEVKYSKQVLNNLALYCSEIRYIIDELAWRELP